MRVDMWAGAQDDAGSENTLTLRLLPEALARTGFPSFPSKPQGRWPATPVFIKDGVVWFSPKSLAAWVDEVRRGRIEHRVESEEAIMEQARALGLGGARTDQNSGEGMRHRFSLDGDRLRKTVYWRLDTDLGTLVVSRATGEGMSRGIHPEQQRLGLRSYPTLYDEEEPV